MDVMGTAMDMAMKDVRNLIGMHSDNEEKAEEDEDFLNMSMLKKKYLNRKRADSDQSNFNGTEVGDNYSRRGG